MKLAPLSLNGSFSTRNATLLARNSSADDTGSLADTPLYKRLRNLQEGVQRLQTMASPASLRKQGAMSKIAFLKQRLDALKAMLLYATPAVAKALAQEVRSIAGELASIAKSLGGGSSGGGSSAAVTLTPASPATASEASEASATPSDSSGSASDVSTAAAAEATTTVAADSTAANMATQETTSATAADADADKDADTASQAGSETTPTSKDSKDSQVHSNSGNTDDNDTALKAALQEARKRLKEVINLLKAKLNPADKKAKHDLQAIEKSLSELDSALQQSAASPASAATSEMSTYSVAGELSAAPVSSGAAVDTAA